jgi:hypothetical protein
MLQYLGYNYLESLKEFRREIIINRSKYENEKGS